MPEAAIFCAGAFSHAPWRRKERELATLTLKIRWDTYPLPTASPAPYNDVASWGIVPAWGYAIVIESTTSIPEGTVLWGFWPTSTVPADLQLKATEPKGH